MRGKTPVGVASAQNGIVLDEPVVHPGNVMGSNGKRKRANDAVDDGNENVCMSDAIPGSGATNESSMTIVCNKILTSIGKYRPSMTNEDNVNLNLDSILRRVSSYKSLLHNMFSDEGVRVPDIPVVSKSYEELYMREPFSNERACVMGDDCECQHIVKVSFKLLPPIFQLQARLGCI